MVFLFAVFSSDNLPLMDATCMFQFEFETKIQNKNLYNYKIEPFEDQLDKSAFFVNKTTDCLALQISNGLIQNNLKSKHTFEVVVSDNNNLSDSTICSIYFTKTCHQILYTLVGLNSQIVNKELYKYIK